MCTTSHRIPQLPLQIEELKKRLDLALGAGGHKRGAVQRGDLIRSQIRVDTLFRDVERVELATLQGYLAHKKRPPP